MQIIVERGSLDGNLKTIELLCHHFYAKDNVRIKDGPEQDVIVCQVNKNQTKTIGYFGSTPQRDAALEVLKRRSSNVLVLDFNRYFCYEAFDDEYAISTLKQDFRNFTMQKHLLIQIDRKVPNPLQSDAFKDLGILFIEAMKNTRPYLVDADKYSVLWAKCLWTPSLVITKGISPRQYYKYLIDKNNEKFSNNNH